jgi:hypothetical protein
MNRQRGISLLGALAGMVLLALLALVGMKVFPAVVEFYSVKKTFATMEASGDTKGTVSEIRRAFDRRALIDGVTVIAGADLDITKDSGETVVMAAWSVKVPIVSTVSLCIDFSATTGKGP